MDAVTTHHDDHDHEPPYAAQTKSNRLGLWLFFFSELFLFGALFVARFSLWGNTRPELSQVVGLIVTSILLLSGYFMFRAESAIAHNDRKAFLSSLLIAAFLGIIFFVGVVVVEWNVFGLQVEGVELFGHLKPTDGVFGGVFFAMTGMHALHVLSGVALILFVWNNGRKGNYSADRYWGVEATALYWHYVDVIWIFFYPALYLIGNVG